MDNEIYVPLSAVLNMVGGCCMNCQEKIRQQIGRCQVQAKNGEVRPALMEIVKNVSLESHVAIDAVIARSNTPRAVEVRREIAIRARSAGYSLPQIGRVLQRHHTTILNLIQPRKLRGQ